MMGIRGRKRKKEVVLNDQKNNISNYVDYPSESIKTQTLVWEYKNSREKTSEICQIPLSKKAALKYWEYRSKNLNDPSASFMIPRIKNESYSSDSQRYFYDNYPEFKILIDQLLYSASYLCILKNYSKRSGDFYPYAMGAILRYIKANFSDIKKLEEFNLHIQNSLYNELTKTNSEYFKNTIKTTTKNIISHGLELLDIDHTLLNRQIKNNTHSGGNTKLDYPQEVSLQLLAAAITEISEAKTKHEEYLLWRKMYKDKSFDSIENLAKAYSEIPTAFSNMDPLPKKGAIYSYQQSYDKLCKDLHGISLNDLNTHELNQLSKKGINIDNLSDPYIMSWFIDDVLKAFPFSNNTNHFNIGHKTNIENFSRWKIKAPLNLYLKYKGRFRNTDLVSLFNDILSRKYPTGEKIIPLIAFWMIQTGSNPEAVVNMKKNVKDEDIYPLDDICVVKSYKNRGTKDYYWFTLNQNEKDGLYELYQFARSYLSFLWEQKNSKAFWSYYSIERSSKITNLTSNRLKTLMDKFILKHKILLPDGSIMKEIYPSRLRNTFITMADLNGATIDDIKEWIRHGNIDARFKFYGNSPEQRSKNFRTIHAIQESMIEDARNFHGKIDLTSYKQKLSSGKISATYLSGCDNAKNPLYIGAKKMKDAHICIDWDMCLLCPQSRVFKENLPRICARLIQYEEQHKKMTAEEWANYYSEKYNAAKDALKAWIKDGGTQEQLNDAWDIARSGKIKLPPLFPVGQMRITKEKDTNVA